MLSAQLYIRFAIIGMILYIHPMVQIAFRSLMVCLLCGILGLAKAQSEFYGDHKQDYLSELYSPETGLPVSTVNQIYQSADGIMWMASMKGLVRFDGNSYQLFDVSNTRGIVSNRMLTIQNGLGDSFWITTEPGYLIHYKDQQFKSYGSFSEGYSKRILVDGDSLTWILSPNGIRLQRRDDLINIRPNGIGPKNALASAVRLKDGSVLFSCDDGRILKSEYPYENTEFYCELPSGYHSGSFWTQDDGSLWWFHKTILKLSADTVFAPQNIAALEASRPRTGEHVTRIDETNNERVFIHAQTGLFELTDDSISVVYRSKRSVRTEAKRQGGVACLCKNDTYWSFTNDSIYANGIFQFTAAQKVTSIFCDRENSVWVTLFNGGVQRFQKSLIQVYKSPTGTNNFYGVYGDSNGATWFGEWTIHLNYLRNNRVYPLDPKYGWGTICSLLETKDHTFFINNQYWKEGPPYDKPLLDNGVRIKEIDAAVYTSFESSDSAIWFGTREGLYTWRKNSLDTVRTTSEIGEVHFILEDHRRELWFASKGGGLHRYIPSEDQWQSYTVQNGLRSNNLRALWEDEKGFIWVATEDNGLNRLDPNRKNFQGISTDKGLYTAGIHSFELDEYQRLWMSSDQGIFYVLLDQLVSFFDGDLDRVSSVAFTEKDGMLNREANGGFQNSSYQDSDGTLWYPTQDGIVKINPSAISFNSFNQNTTISSVSSGDSLLTPEDNFYSLDRDQTDFKIKYISPNFRDQRRFKYRHILEGLNENWQNSGSGNEATYTNLPGGTYTFKVQTYVDDEEAPIAEAQVTIVKTPKVVETIWFKLLVGGSILTIFFIIYQVRLRALKKSQRELEAQVKSRTDSLNQQKKIVEKQKDELLMLDKEKNTFFENISHEFRTPLTLILGPLEELQKNQDTDRSGLENDHLKRIIRNSKRLQSLVEQLLDLTKLESGTARLTAKPGVLNQLLQNVAGDYRDLAHQKNISFQVELTEKDLIVEFDPDELDKVFHNLLSNAFKFTPSGKSIELKLTENSAQAIVTVTDTGKGIAEEQTGRLFDRFYQIQKSEFQPGTGIGLSIAKEITHLHKGEIGVESKEGVGTCFTVTLPIVSNSHDVSDLVFTKKSVHSMDKPRPNGVKLKVQQKHLKKVLIVEDNQEIQAFIRDSLMEKFNVVLASSGNEAWTLLDNDIPDLIVSDIMMADGDGLSFLKKVRSSDELHYLPFILLTSKSEMSDKLSGLDFGADDYLTKPFNMDELELRIDNLIQQRMRLKKFFSERQVSLSEIHLEPISIPSKDEEWISKFNAHIETHLGDEDLTVESLAAHLAMSRASLFRKTKNLFNESPAEIIKRLRMERAKSCLDGKMGNISEIAYSCGFSSLAHFSKSFKQYYGTSPSHYSERGAQETEKS
jgi:signal transduction histidine kinase/DNA-binding response OmpR family regulator/streptogramin lyase